MKSQTLLISLARAAVGLALVSAGTLPAAGRVLDNFNDNTKTDWTDFTFVPGFGLPTEQNGQFRFALPPAGRAIFSASQKVSEVFTLQEGRTIEFRVDVIEGGAKDSFAVLAFIPTTGGGGPGTLAGYGLAKSTTDVLITKGINKYFVADDGPEAELKQDNISLVLKMSVKGGNVTITGQVLDKANNDAVLWTKTVVDTPAADVLTDGTDDPAAPFITAGYFTLYCYADYDAGAPENPYKVYYDNAEVFVLDTTILDDFNDNTKTDWTDFTFVPGFGLPTEQNGQFRFALPPAGRAIFSASQKTSRVFELKEGDRIEFQVDVEEGGAKDSFAVLAFIPTTGGGGPGTLAGYGLAKSTTDILITKGINKYFIADDGPEADLKQNLITLILTMTVRSGSVTIAGKALDKENANAVLWEKTVVDTPAADVLTDGIDDPPAPFITSGYFTLYCYADYDAGAPENPYKVYYDNAIVSAPPLAANVAPVLSELKPAEFANFLAASSQVSFKATDDKDLPNDKLSITLNGQKFTTANGLTVTGTGNTKTASIGGLVANVNYVAVLTAEDSEGLSTSRNLYFDTFATGNLAIEVEDYNFEAGSFINNPVPIPEGGFGWDSYSQQYGVLGTDYYDSRPAPHGTLSMYRTQDHVRMQRSLDIVRAKFAAAGGAALDVYDYDVGDIAAGEWLNYTRNFPTGFYEVYLRQSVVNMASGESVLERVTGDRTQPNAAASVLGSFLGEKTGFQYRNFALTDGTGLNKVVLNLSGVTTLRLRQITANATDGGRYQNYLIFIPTTDPGVQRATVASLAPTPGATVTTVTPQIRVEIQNRQTTVDVGSIQLTLNGQAVTPTVTPQASGAVVTYNISPLPAPGANNSARIAFRDNANVEISADWSFVINYTALDPANRRPTPGIDRGLKVRMVQAPAGTPGLANDLARAESQLAANSTIPKEIETNVVEQVINMSQVEGDSTGYFTPDRLVPGLVDWLNGTDDFAVEVRTWLDLAAGVYRFGVRSDDGYKVSSGKTPSDKDPVIGFYNGGGPPEASMLFDFVVREPGLYPFRMIWYERGGNAYAEWFSVNIATGDRTLINDPRVAQSIKAYQDAPPLPDAQLEAATAVNGPYTVDATATVDVASSTMSVPVPTGNRFYRIRWPMVVGVKIVITSVKIENQRLVLKFDQQPVGP